MIQRLISFLALVAFCYLTLWCACTAAPVVDDDLQVRIALERDLTATIKSYRASYDYFKKKHKCRDACEILNRMIDSVSSLCDGKEHLDDDCKIGKDTKTNCLTFPIYCKAGCSGQCDAKGDDDE